MKNQVFGKFLYAFLFLAILPALLWYWAYLTNDFITWKTFNNPVLGIMLLITGTLLMLWGMWALFHYGKGLPMNAYPPKKFVSQGPYRLFRHPIYMGFILILTGYGLYTAMPGMQWLVIPVALLGVLALVLGYENIHLYNRFEAQDYNPIFALPPDTSNPPSPGKKITMLLIVMITVGITNLVIRKVTPPQAITDNMPWPFETGIWANVLILIFFLGIYLSPLLAKSSSILRQWVIASLTSTTLILFISLAIPYSNGVSFVLNIEIQNLTVIYTSLLIPGISGLLISLGTVRKSFTAKKAIIDFGYILLMFTMISICKNGWIHLFLGLLIFLSSFNLLTLWKRLLKQAEKIANSWHEITIGPLRIINHGIYIGVGALLGTFMIGWLAGEENMWGIVIFAITVTVCSALWAQLIEGSDKLKRPFGFYGALIGIIFAGLLVWYLDYDVWAIIGATSVVMPWIQGIGRLRCLINGCCHGSPIDNPDLGIKYFHYRSRVVSISTLKGQALHPTPVYSIVWLFFAGFVLLAMWQGSMSPAFIFGIYLMLNGLGRFVEEAYRGEVQTPMANKLRLYQWTALGSVISGIVMTCIPVPFPELSHASSAIIPLGSIIIGLFIFFAMGVDFPNSNARFSRLA